MSKTTLSFAVLSGKGGVGKSCLAVNICYSLHLLEQRVLLMDCDMGLANLDVLLGVTPQLYIQDILYNSRQPEEVLVPFKKNPALDLLPANSGLPEPASLDSGTLGVLRDKIRPLFSSYGHLCLDIGAGISTASLCFASMTAMRLVVITPEPTSLTDSYAMMKVMAVQDGVKDFHIIVNQVESRKEAVSAYKMLAMACSRFLDFSPTLLGSVRYDSALTDSVRLQKPVAQLSPDAPAAVDCMDVARKLLDIRKKLTK